MDNKKIGNYLASKRLAKGLTQEQLAARIYVSPKTISKWERGRGLPDVSNLEPLCEALGISIAAFLRGEDEAPTLDERTESDILDLLSAREVYRKRVRALLPLGLLGLLLGIGSVLFAGLYTMADEIRYVFIGIGLALLLIAIPLLCLYDVELGRFRCPHCHEKFRPSIQAYVLGPHAFLKRYLRCPHCGKRGWATYEKDRE
ncbi:MAG: helix-turn-helix transcriptional regulator [Bacillales bacterium]|nr:helix-turn-helix transcriptional regulator [Bacillales bacterium]MDY5920258.1 helix-turn-helix transcriptional regulator [Candidatus Enteromonas sp.]